VYRTQPPAWAPKGERHLRVDAGRRSLQGASLALALALVAAGLGLSLLGLVPKIWAAVLLAPGVALFVKTLAAAFVSHWLRLGADGVELSARLGPLASFRLGSLPPEEGLSVRATPLGGRSPRAPATPLEDGAPLEVELAIEGPSGRLTWRTAGLAASARIQDEVIEALGARLAAGRPGSFHGGRLQVRRSEGRLEIAWPGGPFARVTLVLTPGAWRYENRSFLWRAGRSGGGPLRASAGRAGPGPRRDVEGAGGGRVALQPAGRRALEVGRALTLHERRWLVELVEQFRDVAGAR
jgi:hypothetical protein